MATRRSDQGLREDQGRLFAGRKGRQVKRKAEPFEEGNPLSLVRVSSVSSESTERAAEREADREKEGGERSEQDPLSVGVPTEGKGRLLVSQNLIGARERRVRTWQKRQHREVGSW